MKTEMLLNSLAPRPDHYSFRFDDRFGIAVPFEMQEEYRFDNGTRVRRGGDLRLVPVLRRVDRREHEGRQQPARSNGYISWSPTGPGPAP